MKKYEQKTGRNYVELKIQFSKDYPFMPPFVRVIVCLIFSYFFLCFYIYRFMLVHIFNYGNGNFLFIFLFLLNAFLLFVLNAVQEPRFMFRTGNVTLGGAICMEMLTLTGWRGTFYIIFHSK